MQERVIDVAMLDVAMPAAALSALRSALCEPARPVDQFGPLLDALLAARRSWTHVGVRSFPLDDVDGAEERYRVLVREATGRESVNPAIPFEEASGFRDVARRTGDGERASLAMVTAIVMPTWELVDTAPPSLESGVELLRAMRVAWVHAIACEIVWLPADRIVDGMTRVELEARAPRLRRV